MIYGLLMKIKFAGFIEDMAEEAKLANKLQGDVVGIQNNRGTKVVSYRYESRGKLLEEEGDQTIGNLNPFGYHGYYYVSSWYYDPEIGRWINADGQISGVGRACRSGR